MCTRRQLWTALFSFLLTTTCVLGDDKPCVIHDNGKIYDLNPLKSKTDYQITTHKERKLFLNVCQSVKTETFGLNDDAIAPSEIGAFIRRDHGDFSIGKFNTSLSIFNSDPRFTMADGSQCTSSNSNSRASALVNFICDSSISGVGSPQLVGSLPPGDEDAACAFVIEWKTPYACGVSKAGGFWTFIMALVVTLLILLASYAILGTLYNKFILNLEGLDSIPQFSFQSMRYHLNEALEWSKDVLGILLLNYCSSATGTERGRGYNILPSHNDNPRTPNPVSHQAQVFGIVNGSTTSTTTTTFDEHDQTSHGFTRPKPSPRPTQQQRPTTNPISHHTQTIQSLSQTALSSPQSQSFESHPQTPQTHHLSTTPAPQTHPQLPRHPPQSATTVAPEEDRPFMLFSTEEQDQSGDGDTDVPEQDSKGPAIQL